MPCKLCSCELTKENRHIVHFMVCKPCVARRMREGQQEMRDKRAELEVRRRIREAIRGPSICPCGLLLTQGLSHFYKFDPSRCKKCFIEDQWSGRLKLRKCHECKEELPMTEFTEGNLSTCRSCIKKYKAKRYKVLKACREESPSI
jgi:hypothetical protein